MKQIERRVSMLFKKKTEKWYIKNTDMLHSDIGPAIKVFDRNGRLKREYYYKSGKLHRENGPAIKEYDKKGNIKKERYFYRCRKWTDDERRIFEFNKKIYNMMDGIYDEDV